MNHSHQQKIIKRMARAGIPFALAQISSRKKSVFYERIIIIHLLYHFENLKQDEIAKLINQTQATVSRSMKAFRKKHNAVPNDPNFEKKYSDYSAKYSALIAHEHQDAYMHN